MTRMPGAVSALEPAELLTAAAGTGALLTGGIYAAFHLMVLPALDRLAPEHAARTMRAINDAAERPPFLLLFFGTAGAAVASGVFALGDDGGRPVQVVVGAGLTAAAFMLTMVVNVPLNRRLAAASGPAAGWGAFRRRWGTANTARSLFSIAGGILLLTAR